MSASYALLGRQPTYGYDLKKDYDFYYGNEKPLAFGQVYATLSRLLRDKKIDIESSEQRGGPERKQYTITSIGREDLERWLIMPENLHPNAQSVLFIKVVTAILLDKSPNDYLDAQRSAHLLRMRELTATRRHGGLAESLQADYTIFHLEADLRWIDITTARLQTFVKEVQRER